MENLSRRTESSLILVVKTQAALSSFHGLDRSRRVKPCEVRNKMPEVTLSNTPRRCEMPSVNAPCSCPALELYHHHKSWHQQGRHDLRLTRRSFMHSCLSGERYQSLGKTRPSICANISGGRCCRSIVAGCDCEHKIETPDRRMEDVREDGSVGDAIVDSSA